MTMESKAGRPRSSLRLGFVGLMLLLLAACSAPAPPPRIVTPPPVDSAAACLHDLNRSGVRYEVPKEMHTSDACAIDNPVRVSAITAPWNQSGLMACQLADTLVRFESSIVQPEARRYLGQPIVKIFHLGSYACRNIAGRSRLSMHAKGLAIDISGFETPDGGKINVLKDWSDNGPKGHFLRAVAKDSCNLFNVVLTPNHDKDHQNHLHLDIGPYRLCGL